MSEPEGPCCENCGHEFKEGDEIQSQATGTWTEGHAQLDTDHFIMCLNCPEPE